MFYSIARFELRYQLRAPVFFIGFALFFLLSFASVTIDTVQIGARGNVNINSPSALMDTIAIMNVFALFIVAAFVANVVLRDDETRIAPLIRSTRVTKAAYLGGRFTGAMTVAALVLLAVPLAMLIGSWMPWLDSEKVGPFVAQDYLFAYFFTGLPPLLVIGALMFALATATRSMMWTYVGLLALLVLYIGTRVALRDPSWDTVAVLSDPFGISWLSKMTRYWTTTERNTMLPSLDRLGLLNRLLWGAVAVLCYGFAYLRFSFGERTAKIAPASLATEASSAPITRVTPSVQVGRPSGLVQLIALVRFDMRLVFRSPAFYVLIAIGAFNAFGALTTVTTVRDIAYLPVTRAVVAALTGSYALFAIVIAIYYSGELVWGDHDSRMDEITGVMPAPDWVFVVPKILAITVVLLVSYLFAALVGIGDQLAHGYTHIELESYLLWFILPRVIEAFQYAALAIFVQVLVKQKFIGWAVMLLYIVAQIALVPAGFENHLYDYSGTSPVPLSDMNGMGRFWIGRAWFQVYWTAGAIILLALSHALWRRGRELRLSPRLAQARQRLAGVPGLVLAFAVLVMVASGCYIYTNTSIWNPYETAQDQERYTADAERALLKFEHDPEPKITAVTLKVDLFPDQVRAVTHGEYEIENHTEGPLSQVELRWNKPLKMQRLEVEGARLDQDFGRFNYRIYRFAKPMQPGEKRAVVFDTVLEQKGFPNERPLTNIVDNGTFINDQDISPGIGVERRSFLTERAKRRKYGLPADLRPPKLEDQSARAFNYLRHDSDWVTADITLSTDADQTPVAPGYTVSDTVANGRRILHTRSDAPILHFLSMQSARYAEDKSTWSPSNGTPVALDVYSFPAHHYNVDTMLSAMQASLGLFSEQFSPFQFHQMRILEFPAYQTFAQSFTNTVPFSEAIGFVQKPGFAKGEDAKHIDLVTYVTAHEIGHQWWAHQVIGADMQGMTMLSESFAQYSALLVMEKLYGPSMIRKFLKNELDGYLRARGGEGVEELPLIRVEDQPYIHYEKGALVMYWLKDSVGEEVVNRSLRRLIQQFAFKGPPYPSSADFVRILREEAGPQYNDLITDLFERITLYDMSAHDAHAKKRPDGKYDLTFSVTGKKLYADGQGKETESPLSEPFDIGAFTAEPGKKGFTQASVLDFEKRNLVTGKQQIALVVDQLPKWVGVDPYNKRIDRNSDDNLTKVTLDQ
jgi:aminopeptidase N